MLSSGASVDIYSVSYCVAPIVSLDVRIVKMIYLYLGGVTMLEIRIRKRYGKSRIIAAGLMQVLVDRELVIDVEKRKL